MMKFTEYNWSDIKPIPLDEGPIPLATIAYPEEYRNAMDLLRAVMKTEEYSERALAVTTVVIQYNPAHYTVWEYRSRILRKVGSTVIPKSSWLVQGIPSNIDMESLIIEDGDWLNQITLDHSKNYQIWHYRQQLEVPGCLEYYNGELLVIRTILEDDSKNYHAWSHLLWL